LVSSTTFSPFFSIRHKRKQTDVDHSELNVSGIIQCAIGVKDLVELWLFRMLDVDDRQTLAASGNIRVGSGQIQTVGIAERY